MSVLDLDDDQRYLALKSRDARFDGRFIVGVRTTGIYCRPSCPTPVQPLRRNVDFFATAAAAQRAGLRACKRCRPDASPGSPEWNLRDDLIGRAMRLIARGHLDRHSVGHLAAELGVTERHLRRLMIESVGAPPIAIARAQRAQTARVLIETTDLTFTEIAFAAGFSSLRQFNDTIRSVFANTPTELRAKVGSVTNAAASGPLSLRLPFRQPLAAEYLCRWWQARSVPGVARVHNLTIEAAFSLGTGVAHAELTFEQSWVDCRLELSDIADLAAVVAACRAMLDLDADPAHIDESLRSLSGMRPLITARPGLRSPGSVDGFATLVFAILGQQRSVAAARTLAGRIVEQAIGPANDETLRPFPDPAAVADADLSDIGLNGRAIDTITSVAERFDGRVNELSPAGDRGALRDELLTVKGIGPWTANYVAMRTLGDPDVYLAGDLVADRAAASLGLDAAAIDSVRPWRSYLTHHLWAASADLAAKGTT